MCLSAAQSVQADTQTTTKKKTKKTPAPPETQYGATLLNAAEAAVSLRAHYTVERRRTNQF